jgi:hypothetical protein
MMEQLAAQRRRFMQASAMETDMSAEDASDDSLLSSDKSGSGGKMSTDVDDGDGSGSDGSGAFVLRKEYTCCHCLAQGPASEDRPIGLVTWIQSTSVLAHRHHKSGHLNLPVREEEEELLKLSLEESLGAELKARFHEMVRTFGQKPVLLSLNRSWNGGKFFDDVCRSSQMTFVLPQASTCRAAATTCTTTAGRATARR